MTQLYQCDKCEHQGPVSERMNVTLIPPGKTFKDQVRIDLCVDCTKKYLASATILLK